MQTFTLTGDVTLLATALELAVEHYNRLARESVEYPRVAEQFRRQASQAQGFLDQAWRIRDE